MKRNEGFTLVELLVAMVVGSIVTLAATSVLLLGLRYNAISIGAAQRQNTTRIIMSLLEGVASEGQIKGVESNLQGWTVLGTDDFSILSYDGGKKVIYTSDSDSPLLEGVYASYIELNSDNLLTVYVETEDGSYVSSIYCRMNKPDSAEKNEGITDTKDEVLGEIDDLYPEGNAETDREKFIRILLSQHAPEGLPNPGMIFENGELGPQYYAQWYAEAKGITNKADWNSGTPWCACFISWAMRQVYSTVPIYANVDTFMASFQIRKETPKEGDLVFFDWEGGDDPEHVGVVVLENGDFIYTVEGNSAGLVAMRMYSTKDPAIIGYGDLDAILDQSLERQILAKINDLRTEQNNPDVKVFESTDDGLNSAAIDYAEKWANDPGFSEPAGGVFVDLYCLKDLSDLEQRIREHDDYQSVVSGLQTRCGIGLVIDNNQVYIVVLLD